MVTTGAFWPVSRRFGEEALGPLQPSAPSEPPVQAQAQDQAGFAALAGATVQESPEGEQDGGGLILSRCSGRRSRRMSSPGC